jgi:hypothetical protein
MHRDSTQPPERWLVSLGVFRMPGKSNRCSASIGDYKHAGRLEEVLHLIATSGDRVDLQALSEKYAIRNIGPRLLAVKA